MTYEYLSYILLWSSTIHYYIYIYEFLPVMRLLTRLGGFCYPKKVSTSIYKLFKLSIEGKNFYILSMRKYDWICGKSKFFETNVT